MAIKKRYKFGGSIKGNRRFQNKNALSSFGSKMGGTTDYNPPRMNPISPTLNNPSSGNFRKYEEGGIVTNNNSKNGEPLNVYTPKGYKMGE